MPKYRVQYTVSFETFIECEPGELVDEVPNIYIPEDDENKYLEDSYETEGIYLQKANGEEVEVDDFGKVIDEDDDFEQKIRGFQESLASEEEEDDKEDDYF